MGNIVDGEKGEYHLLVEIKDYIHDYSHLLFESH